MMEEKKSRWPFKGLNRKSAGKHGKKLFWAWIIYQTVKGITTTSLIWIPLIYLWLEK